MDTLSHAVWGATLIRKSPLVWWAALTGALPDLIPAVFGVVRFRMRYFQDMVNQQFAEHPDGYYMKIYRFTHSLIPITVVTVAVAVIWPDWWVLAIPYYLHLCLDIFTHRGVWATRLFYPVSDFHFDGNDWWKNQWINIANWAAISALNILFIAT